jgi:hypothetical protein
MVTSEERMRVLKMIQEGKISAEDGLKLLETLESTGEIPAGVGSKPGAQGNAGARAKWLHIRVTDTRTDKIRVNLRLPISLLNAGSKIGARISTDVDGLDMDRLMTLIRSGEMGRVVDVVDEKDGEHVEAFLE